MTDTKKVQDEVIKHMNADEQFLRDIKALLDDYKSSSNVSIETQLLLLFKRFIKKEIQTYIK